MIDNIRNLMKKYGFVDAAESMDFKGFTKANLRHMLDAWKHYPTNMEIFPVHLQYKRIWDEETQAVIVVN